MVESLVDTNAAIALLKRNPDILRALRDKRLHFSIVVLGELCFGAFNSARVDDNLRDADILMGRNPIHGCDEETAREYGKIKAQLRRIGRPIPDNDIWIAACAKQHGLQLVTRDGHFQHVSGLETMDW
ncbi:MAG TPA: type II toxin-antitoxin system VapC family toxin [Candidatus Kapabacteria bacterium]|nr:type II toxin-antitoxin system VapC family toxin [Candidatus Kapabacteria bacterium]